MTHFFSTSAHETTCPTCGRPILTALDEGLPVHVDPDPVDHTGEIAALLQGRWTYSRIANDHLVHRDADRLRGGIGGDIHVEHRCTTTTLF